MLISESAAGLITAVMRHSAGNLENWDGCGGRRVCGISPAAIRWAALVVVSGSFRPARLWHCSVSAANAGTNRTQSNSRCVMIPCRAQTLTGLLLKAFSGMLRTVARCS